MDKISLYIKESYDELINKVSWPEWANLQSSTIVVIVASLLIALIIFVMDLLSKQITGFLYGL
jgi:preprotein translocase subunit SecE